MSIFNVLFGIVPCSPSRGHRNSDKKSCNDGSKQHSTECSESFSLSSNPQNYKVQDGRGENREHRGNNHFANSCFCQKVHRFAVFWLCCSFHDSFDFSELATYF